MDAEVPGLNIHESNEKQFIYPTRAYQMNLLPKKITLKTPKKSNTQPVYILIEEEPSESESFT